MSSKESWSIVGLRATITRLEAERDALRAELDSTVRHYMTSPHDGCECSCCKAMRDRRLLAASIAAVEAERDEARTRLDYLVDGRDETIRRRNAEIADMSAQLASAAPVIEGLVKACRGANAVIAWIVKKRLVPAGDMKATAEGLDAALASAAAWLAGKKGADHAD